MTTGERYVCSSHSRRDILFERDESNRRLRMKRFIQQPQLTGNGQRSHRGLCRWRTKRTKADNYASGLARWYHQVVLAATSSSAEAAYERVAAHDVIASSAATGLGGTQGILDKCEVLMNLQVTSCNFGN